MSTRSFIGYDWFKLIVAFILALLLLWLAAVASGVPAPVLSAVAPAIVFQKLV